MKVVLAAAMWNTPHIVILDEPTNYLDRDSLGAMAEAINLYEGGVVIISHNAQFVDQVCPEVWHLENHTLNLKRFEIVVESCERFQIGWYYPDPAHAVWHNRRPITFPAITLPDLPGVGEEGSTFAFDAARGGICFKGALKTPCPGVSIEPGSIVACERDGTRFKWSVDGSLVSEVDLADGLTFPWAKELLLPEQTHHSDNIRGYRPAISAKGQWRLKDFSFYQS